MYGIHPDTVRDIAASEAAELRRAAGRRRQRRNPRRARPGFAMFVVR